MGDVFVAPLLDLIGKPVMRDALAMLAARPGERVADVGLGGGWFERQLRLRGARVAGVDISPVVVARLKRRFRRDRDVEIVEGSAESMPLDDASCDAIASVNVLYFWDDLGCVFREFARVTRPGGRLVLGHQTAASVRAWPGHVHGFHAHDCRAIDSALMAAGWTIAREAGGHDWRVRDYRCLLALRAGR